MSQKNKYITALKAAFPYTIPIFAGFTFLGLTYGIFMNVSGFPFWYPMLMSMTIFAGSSRGAFRRPLLHEQFRPLKLTLDFFGGWLYNRP